MNLHRLRELKITPRAGFIRWLVQQLLRRKTEDHRDCLFIDREPMWAAAQLFEACSIMAKCGKRFTPQNEHPAQLA